MSFGRLERELYNCIKQYPPDFEGARNVLQMGADINAQDAHSSETILSEILCGYPNFIESFFAKSADNNEERRETERDGRYIPKIVKLFLENGYTVAGQNGRYGAMALYVLCYSSYDKYILDAAKMLLDAGTDPLCVLYDDETPLSIVETEMSAAVAVEGSLEQECLFEVLRAVLEARIKGEPYDGLQWNDAVIGKRVERIYSCASAEEKAVYAVTIGRHHYDNAFREDIILECEGVPLRITGACHAYVNPYHLPNETQRIDLGNVLNSIIGKRIKSFRFSVNRAEKDKSLFFGSVLEILFAEGGAFIIKDNGDSMDEEYCTFFQIKD